MKIVACLIALIVGNSFAIAQAKPVPAPNSVEPPRILPVTSTLVLQVPQFVGIGKTLCDNSGNMFFNVGFRIGQMGPFLGITADGRSHIIYSLPSGIKNWGNVKGVVSPGGQFSILYSNYKTAPMHRLIHYEADGTVGRVTPLEIPDNASVQNIAIEDSGVTYVRGLVYTKEKSGKVQLGYAALLSDSGKLIRNLSFDAAGVDPEPREHSLPEGDAAAGIDGRFYILEPTKVIVLNQSGDIERILKYDKPDHSAFAARIDVSEGLVSIELDTVKPFPNEADRVYGRMLLLNAQTGELREDAVFDPEGSGMVCFRGEDGYSVYGFPTAAKMTTLDMVSLH